jgi:DNA repair protein RadC
MITYSEYEQTAIKVALTAIQQTLVTDNVLSSVVQVENYLKLNLADEPDEWFGVIFLTSQHRLIRFDKLFRGTVNASYVHIRVIARKPLSSMLQPLYWLTIILVVCANLVLLTKTLPLG